VQLELAQAVIATGKPVVVVLTNGRPLAVPWLHENAGAILESWYLGLQAGPAVADLLLGKRNPEGKLSATFPRSVGQIPIYHSYLNTGRPKSDNSYSSRYIDSENTPLYAFGHGLSYTQFEYSGLKLPERVGEGQDIEVEVTLRNAGGREGAEVVQLYIGDTVASVARPVRELKAFKKVRLQAGQSEKVGLRLRPQDLAFHGRDMRFGYEPGEFKVFVGGDSVSGEQASFIVESDQNFITLKPSPLEGARNISVPGGGVKVETVKKKISPAPSADGVTGPTGP
jgi:beta-glucosidase